MPTWTTIPGTGDIDLQGGAVSNLLVKGRPWEDVRAHGAVGDGVADDGPAWNTTRAVLPSTGGTVLVPPGSYKLTTAFTFAAQTNVTVLLMPGVTLSGSTLPAQTSTNRIVDMRHGWGPIATNGIQYVSPNGLDTNDGLSWGSSKLTIIAAYDALPSTGGSIYVTAAGSVRGQWGGEVVGQGLWLIGPADPLYNSPPAGWRQQKHLRLIGVAGQYHTANATGIPTVSIGPADIAGPSIACAGTNTPMSFEHLAFENPGIGIRIGLATDGVTSASTSSLRFFNIQASITGPSTSGPVVSVGQSFWVWFEHCTFGAFGNADAADKKVAFLIKPSTGSPSTGLFFIHDTNVNGSAVRYYSGNSTWSLRVKRMTTEGQPAASTGIDFVAISNSGTAIIEDFEIADYGAGAVSVRVPIGTAPDVVVVRSIDTNQNPVGPATLFDTSPNRGGQSQTLAGARQVGLWANRLAAQYDSTRRAFGPAAIRFANLAPQDVSTWAAKLGNGTVTTGITAPDGTMRAATLTSPSGTDGKSIVRQSRSIAVGDWLIGGVWIQAIGATGLSTAIGFQLITNGNTFDLTGTHQRFVSMPLQGDGEWEWVSDAVKIITVTTSPDTVDFSLRVTAGVPCNFYAPIFMHIPSGTVSDNEALELAQHLQSWSDSGVIGEMSTLATHIFNALGGLKVDTIATASLPAAAAAQNGRILLEDAGAGDRNLIIYAQGQRFRIDGGAAF